MPWVLLAVALALLLPGWIAGTKAAPSGTTLTATLPIDLRRLGAAPVVSPDAKYVVWAGSDETRHRLHLRAIATGQTRVVDGTDGAEAPFFSPSGQWVAFFVGSKLVRMPADGGRIEELATVADHPFRTGAWTTRDEIVVMTVDGLHRLTAQGGRLTRIPDEADRTCIWPIPTPDGRHVACNIGGPGGVEDDYLNFVEVATGRRTATTIAMRNPIGFHLGHLVFRQGVDQLIMAVKFDEKRVTVEGEPFQLHGPTRAFSLAHNGTAIAFEDDGLYRLVMRAGESSSTVWSPPWPVKSPRLSPDGRYMVVVRAPPAVREVWIYDIAARTPTRLAATGDTPAWTPDGTRVVYTVPVVGTMTRTSEARWRRADLGSPEESVAKADSASITGVQVAPDGRTLVLWTERNGAGIWRAGINTQPWVQLVGNEGRVLQPTISSDGRWLAYVTDESGAMEVVVRPLDAAGGRVTISDGGGTEPVWDRRGNGLFYRNGNEFIRASLRFDPSLRVAGRSVVLRGAFGQWSDVGYDVTNDGERLLVTESITGGQLVIVVNWLGELRKRMN